MKADCAVIRDLLPLYAENLTSEESGKLIEEHLVSCTGCCEYLENLRQPQKMSLNDSDGPIRQLKEEIRRRKWRTAGIAALAVFVILFAVLARMQNEEPIPYSPELLKVLEFDGSENAECRTLHILHSDAVQGVASRLITDDVSGERTLYLQYWGKSRNDRKYYDKENGYSINISGIQAGTSVYNPTPDRVIYGFGQEQTLIFGEPMEGGTEILPRLVLSYYALIAACLTILFGILRVVFRTKAGTVLRQLYLVPLSYLAGQLLIKGTETISFFLQRDLIRIIIEAAAVYGLITLLVSAWQQSWSDRIVLKDE